MSPFDEPARAPAPPPPAPRRYEVLLGEHTGIAFTLAYVFLSALGMLHTSLVFLRFRVNIFDFAEPSDFLLAALRDPLVVLVCVAPVPFFWGQHRLFRWLEGRYPRWSDWSRRVFRTGSFGAAATRRMNVLATLLWALAFSLNYANLVSDRIVRGEGKRVQVHLASEGLRPEGALPASRPLLLGRTSSFVFLYYPAERQTRIVPVENIAQLVVERPPRRGEKAAVPTPSPVQP